MRLQVLAVGDGPPAWARAACADYCSRVRAPFRLELRRLAATGRRPGPNPAQAMAAEAKALRAATAAGSLTVALDLAGQAWSTEDLAGKLGSWSQTGQPVSFWIGGPDGLDAGLIAAADLRWSLSRLTLPHALAQVVVTEQLYRAWSLLQGHPYHRA